jgi:SOS-response transcriptional repressor LexA
MTLTKRQKQVLDFLVAFHDKQAHSPSFEEMVHSPAGPQGRLIGQPFI